MDFSKFMEQEAQRIREAERLREDTRGLPYRPYRDPGVRHINITVEMPGGTMAVQSPFTEGAAEQMVIMALRAASDMMEEKIEDLYQNGGRAPW